MTSAEKPRRVLARILRKTRARELDCDAFRDQLAAYIEGGLDDAELLALMEHHREFCPECEEEHQLLRRALGLAE